MNQFWTEEPFQHGKYSGTKFIWPKDRLICFGVDGTCVPMFSVGLGPLLNTILEDIITSCVLHYIDSRQPEAIEKAKADLRSMCGHGENLVPDWIDLHPEDKDTLPHIHLVQIENDESYIGIYVDSKKIVPTTDFYTRHKKKNIEKHLASKERDEQNIKSEQELSFLKTTLSSKPPCPGYEGPAPCQIDDKTGMHQDYWVLPEADRSRGYVRPFRTTYIHEKCGGSTSMNSAIAGTYAANPFYYSGTFCAKCGKHFPVGTNGEFVWEDGSKVGT